MTTWHNAAGPPGAPLFDHHHHRPGETCRAQDHQLHPRHLDDPQKWSFQYSDEELQDYGLKMTLAADALLLGRITYEGMAQAWPTRGGNPFADHVNSITKYVVASQPVDPTAWEPTVVIAGPDLLDEVSRLKQADGGDLLIWGTGRLTEIGRAHV